MMILANGMATWDVATWTAFFGALTLLIGAITTSIISIMNARNARAEALKAQKQAETATTTATTANTVAAEARGMSFVQNDRMNNVGNQVAAIGLATKPPDPKGP